MTATAIPQRNLTEAQQREYREKGFIVVRGVLNAEQVATYRCGPGRLRLEICRPAPRKWW